MENMITIEFFGMQHQVTKRDGLKMPITEKTTVNDVIEYVMKNYPELVLDKHTHYTAVNSVIVSPDKLLKPNDNVCFLPAISGG